MNLTHDEVGALVFLGIIFGGVVWAGILFLWIGHQYRQITGRSMWRDD